MIYLVDPETNNLYLDEEKTQLPRPQTRYDVLNRLDRNTYRLVQFPAQEGEGERGFIPVCKIVNKKEIYAHQKKKKEETKEKKRVENAAKSVKTLELNWAIDPNDLGHRLDRVQEFLTEGRKVEIVLANKKRGKKAGPDECEEVVQKIRKTVDTVSGAKEVRIMEGKLGGFATLLFQGKAQQQAANPSKQS